MTASPIIIALDVGTAAEARSLVQSLGQSCSFYKVGLELYASAGMDFVRELKQQGHRVFLDLKLHDIEETVKRAVIQVAHVGVDFLTIHGVRSVMQAAVEGRGESPVELLAISVLTNLDDQDLKSDGYQCTVAELVALRTRNAVEARVDGIVCSPLEVARVRAIAGPNLTLVTPGVRSAGSAAGDQKRVATPAAAIANGADFLVMGRQITRAPDPRAEMLRVLEEVSQAAPGRETAAKTSPGARL
jgi:orotidine-5'-phosphate decarboxylase